MRFLILLFLTACGDVAPQPADAGAEAGCLLDADDALNCAICGVRCVSLPVDGGAQ